MGNNAVFFPNLKTLVGDNLPNLREVEIEAPLLANLSLNNCGSLQTVYEINCSKLHRIQVNSCC